MSNETCICPDPIGGKAAPARSICSSVAVSLFRDISASTVRAVMPIGWTCAGIVSGLYMTDIGYRSGK